MTQDVALPLDAFIRSIRVNRHSPHTFFLGAGASISSGVPSAARCIWEWKREIFLTNNPGLEDQFSELSLSGVQERIQRWLDLNGYPRRDAPEEYGFYIERCFPIPEHRRLFFQEVIQQAHPHVGYKLLCLMAQAGVVQSVWTTNFDGLTAKAAAGFQITPIEIGIDCQHRLPRSPRRGQLLSFSLHGDYRYDPLKNTEEELQEQEAALRERLIEELGQTHLIVSGYSGRDASIMGALNEAYSCPGTGTLYWCGHGDTDPPEAVASLIRTARSHGRTALYVPSQGFDDLLTRLAFRCLQGDELESARKIAGELSRESILDRSPFSTEDHPLGGLIKSNAFPIDCPSDVLELDIEGLPDRGTWRWLRDKTADRDVVAVPYRGKVLALGTTDAVKDCFADELRGAVERTPVDEKELRHEDSHVIHLFLAALTRSFEVSRSLKSDGKRVLWDDSQCERRVFGGMACFVYQSTVLSLRRFGSSQLLVIHPSVMVRGASGDRLDEQVERDIKQKVLGYQHNDKFNSSLNFWRKKLLPEETTTIEFPPRCGSTFRFRVKRAPLFAGIGDARRKRPLVLNARDQKLLTQRGIILDEPSLLFADRSSDDGRLISDVHPIRGIIENRPFDYSLTRRGLADRISVGVVCPGPESRRFTAFFDGFSRAKSPHETERDYLLDYPGFQSAFGLPLQFPDRGGAGWATCPEIDPKFEAQAGSVELARSITAAVDALHASCRPNVTLICIPFRWAAYRGYKTEEEKFDLHDFVKAYCVQRGIATQFIEEDTLTHPQLCRVYWWLSLALYVKSFRTPWLLDALEPDTAYVGIGYGIDDRAMRGSHIVMGCSHIYNSRGEGLQFRLSKIENPIFRRGHPFMSEDDARRAGNSIRQHFFDTMTKLPSRVVIHKRTPFIRSEREGLAQGLSGVNALDLIEINIDGNLRYLSSFVGTDGNIQQDRFPVQRGTAVVLDAHSALLWGHGVTTALQPGRKYYQGKRRIPAPLILRRHAGRSSLNLLGQEILGLSKMNWNTFDLYTKIPATIESSNEIAKIGSLLDRLGARSYDYRLFM
jgi:hypothetical protein